MGGYLWNYKPFHQVSENQKIKLPLSTLRLERAKRMGGEQFWNSVSNRIDNAQESHS